MSGGDLQGALDPGPQRGPSRADLVAAVMAAGNPHAGGFGDRVLAALPRHYSAAEIEQALEDGRRPPAVDAGPLCALCKLGPSPSGKVDLQRLDGGAYVCQDSRACDARAEAWTDGGLG